MHGVDALSIGNDCEIPEGIHRFAGEYANKKDRNCPCNNNGANDIGQDPEASAGEDTAIKQEEGNLNASERDDIEAFDG